MSTEMYKKLKRKEIFENEIVNIHFCSMLIYVKFHENFVFKCK